MPGSGKKEDEIYASSLFPTPPPVKYLAEGTNQRAGCKRGVNTSTGAPGRQPSGEAPARLPAPRGATGRDPLQAAPGVAREPGAARRAGVRRAEFTQDTR